MKLRRKHVRKTFFQFPNDFQFSVNFLKKSGYVHGFAKGPGVEKKTVLKLAYVRHPVQGPNSLCHGKFVLTLPPEPTRVSYRSGAGSRGSVED